MQRRGAVTIWNMLALVAVVAGAGGTLLADQLSLQRWAGSGVRVPLADLYEITLPAGDCLVYYESRVKVPTGDVLLMLRSAEGTVIRPGVPDDDNSFRLLLGGWSGRALWSFSDLEAGDYTVTVTNPHYLSNREIPAEDRVVFAKRPNTLAEITGRRRTIHIVGVSLTVLAAAALFATHARRS